MTSASVGFSNEGFVGHRTPNRPENYSMNNHFDRASAPPKPKESNKGVKCILILMGILIIGLIVAIVIVAVIFSPLLEDNKNNKKLITDLQNKINDILSDMEKVNSKYKELENKQTVSAQALQTYKKDTTTDIIALQEFQTTIKTNISGFDTMLYTFAFEGLGYGRNKDAQTDHECFAANDHLACLTSCLEKKKQMPTINGVNIRRLDNECCCEKAIDLSKEKDDRNYLHYVLQRI